jgi:3'-phosphoadenosine 5'-phosphosulfate sulfotransferase (PAPS reductase)/FAD synthetase
MELTSFKWELLNDQRVLLGLSGGINSMAVLCELVKSGAKPKELHLYYAHFKEHSPDTFKFVADGIRYARIHFENVVVKITRTSVLEYFSKIKMIPHPKRSPCSINLKIEPINRYAFENGLTIDLIGYVKKELQTRAARQQKVKQVDLFSLDKYYPIGDFDDEWCFQIVKDCLGWYPAIYDIRYTIYESRLFGWILFKISDK